MVKSVSSKLTTQGSEIRIPFPGCVTLGMLPNLSEPRLPYPQNEIIGHLRGLSDVVPASVSQCTQPMAAAFILNIIYEQAFLGAPCYRLGEQTWSPTLGHPQFDEETRDAPAWPCSIQSSPTPCGS